MSVTEDSPRVRVCRDDISRTVRCINFNGNEYFVGIYVTAFAEMVTDFIDVIDLFSEMGISKPRDHVNYIMKNDRMFKSNGDVLMLKDHFEV